MNFEKRFERWLALRCLADRAMELQQVDNDDDDDDDNDDGDEDDDLATRHYSSIRATLSIIIQIRLRIYSQVDVRKKKFTEHQLDKDLKKGGAPYFQIRKCTCQGILFIDIDID